MRKETITEEIIVELSENLAEGLPIPYACDLLGITQASFQGWMRLGQKEYEEGLDSLQAKLFAAVKKSQAIYIKVAMKVIQSGNDGWQGMAWWLERTQMTFQKNESNAGGFNENITINSSIKRNKK